MIGRVKAAFKRISGQVRYTPLEYSLPLSQQTGVDTYLKLENHQLTGSFKLRGAMNKILEETEAGRTGKTFVAASTGNHAAAFAYCLSTFGLDGIVYMPASVTKTKLDFIKSYGVPYQLFEGDPLNTEVHARSEAEAKGYVFVSPYNDEAVVAGQGTIGYELQEQLPDMDAVIVPVGGGGMISGIAAYLKSLRPEIRIIGCQPEQSPEMYESIRQGRIITESITRPTLSDATAGGIEPGAITFDLVKAHVDEIVLISEEEIGEGIRWMLQHHQMVIEGSAAMSLATLRRMKASLKGRKVALIICSKRLSYDKLQKIIC